jgi:hypothetical protein
LSFTSSAAAELCFCGEGERRRRTGEGLFFLGGDFLFGEGLFFFFGGEGLFFFSVRPRGRLSAAAAESLDTVARRFGSSYTQSQNLVIFSIFFYHGRGRGSSTTMVRSGVKAIRAFVLFLYSKTMSFFLLSKKEQNNLRKFLDESSCKLAIAFRSHTLCSSWRSLFRLILLERGKKKTQSTRKKAGQFFVISTTYPKHCEKHQTKRLEREETKRKQTKKKKETKLTNNQKTSNASHSTTKQHQMLHIPQTLFKMCKFNLIYCS